MGFRSDIPSTGRDFFFSPVGHNNNSGFSDENPVATPTEAINKVNALAIPPSASDPASIDAAVTGTYSSGITIPAFTTCNARFASIVTFDSTILTCEGNHTVTWGALLSLTPGGTVVSIDGEDRVAVEVNAMITTGDGSTGINLTGSVSEIFFEVRSADINGDGSIFVDHTADSSTSVEYNLENVRFMDENETVVRYNDTGGTTATIFNVSSIQADPGAASTAGSVIFDVIAGTLLVDAELLVGETVALVKTGGTLVLDALTVFGDTLVSDGGIGVYKSVGVITGDLETSGSGTLQVTSKNIFGNTITAGTGGVSINSDQVVGDITVGVGTTAFLLIDTHVGTLTNNGTINGIVNGVRYGNWAITPTDISCRVTKTSDQTIPNNTLTAINWDSESYDTDGMHDTVTNNSRITFNTAGKYSVTAQSSWQSNGSGARVLDIVKNGNTGTPIGRTKMPNTDTGAENIVSYVGEFAVNDYIELCVFQNRGGNLNFLSGGFEIEETYLEVHKWDSP